MVAAAKLKRAQEKAEGSRAFYEKTRNIFENVAGAVIDTIHPLLVERDGDRVGYIIITADKGLAGGYNIKMINEVVQHIEDKEKASLFTIGRKGREFFNTRKYNVVSEYLGIDDNPDFSLAQKIAQEVIQLYEEDVFDRVILSFMRFKSALNQIPTLVPLLPIQPEQEGNVSKIEYIYEPSASEVLDWILPKYVENLIYSALLEAKASEFGARMTAMDSATENAQEMIEKLTLTYNRARQAAITTEISEIISGAEALK